MGQRDMLQSPIENMSGPSVLYPMSLRPDAPGCRDAPGTVQSRCRDGLPAERRFQAELRDSRVLSHGMARIPGTKERRPGSTGSVSQRILHAWDTCCNALWLRPATLRGPVLVCPASSSSDPCPRLLPGSARSVSFSHFIPVCVSPVFLCRRPITFIPLPVLQEFKEFLLRRGAKFACLLRIIRISQYSTLPLSPFCLHHASSLPFVKR